MSISISDYKKFLLNVVKTDKEKKMLIVNYEYPQHTITATEMANELGYSYFGNANLAYGKLGRKIEEFLGIEGIEPQKTGHLVYFYKPENEWYWILKENLCTALEELGWVSIDDNFTESDEYVGGKDYLYLEGSLKTIKINKYERNKLARKKCIEHYGAICQICGLEFCKMYGEVAEGYIQVHHIKSLSEINKEYKVDPIKDLIPICPNCHAVVHLKRPHLGVEEVKKLLAASPIISICLITALFVLRSLIKS